MKIYTKVSWKYDEKLKQYVETSSESFEYKGALALCFGDDWLEDMGVGIDEVIAEPEPEPDDWISGVSQAGRGTGGAFGEDFEMDTSTIVEEFFPDMFDWDIAESSEDWWDTYGAYFHDYDPTKENIRGRSRDLEIENWQQKMLKDKTSLDFMKGSGGFVSSGTAKEYDETLTDLGQIEFLEGEMSKLADVYGFKESWQNEVLSQVDRLTEMGAFAEAPTGVQEGATEEEYQEAIEEEVYGGSCTQDSDCSYGATCEETSYMGSTCIAEGEEWTYQAETPQSPQAACDDIEDEYGGNNAPSGSFGADSWNCRSFNGTPDEYVESLFDPTEGDCACYDDCYKSGGFPVDTNQCTAHPTSGCIGALGQSFGDFCD